MDFESPQASKVHDDSYDDELDSSELKESHLYKSLAESKRSSEDPVLNYRDILTDQQTLDFIKKHFSQNLIEVSFRVDTFIEVLLQEFFLRNPSVVSTIDDVKLFKKELKKLLKTSLTTNDDDCLSLNALEVNTKTKGLYNYVFDLAMEAQSMMKIQENNKINEAILEEFSAVSKMLQTKKQELIQYELRLKELERSLIEKEENMKYLLQSEYERLVKSFEESYNLKISGLQKRVLTNEKTTKTKLKVIETKVKEFKSSSSATSNNEDKLKFKIVSLEKTNDFLKLKTQDLEKKMAIEQEAKNALTKKNEKLSQKITTLEKSLNEKSMMASVDKKDLEERAQFASIMSEKPLEVIDLNASQQKAINEQFDEDEYDEFRMEESSKPIIIAAPTKEEKAGTAKKTSKVLTFDSSNAGAEAPKKKVVPKTSSDEIRVLLNVIHNMVVSLKSTLPVMIHNSPQLKSSMPIEELIKGIDIKKPLDAQELEDEEKNFDIGEIFYPCFNNLVGNLTELLPMLSKPYNVKHIFTLSELYYRLLDFFFKFKVQKKFQSPYLNEFEIQNSIHKVKSNQDHVNEIMASSRIMEISFTPQTEFWKKILKTSKPLHKNKTVADLQNSVMKSLNKENKAPNKSSDPCLDLFSDDVIQKETTNLLKKYLDITEFMLRKESQQENTITFQTSMNIETQKYVQMTRVYISLLVLMLSRNKKEQGQALSCLLSDLNSENAKISEYLRQFFIENDGLDIVIWHVEQAMDDFPTVQVITDLLLTLNYNGNHYKQFISLISQQQNINIILDLVMKYRENNEFCEKMCVMFQRITYHNNLKGKVEQRYIKFFREKLNDMDILKNKEFFVSNVKSILLNIES